MDNDEYNNNIIGQTLKSSPENLSPMNQMGSSISKLTDPKSLVEDLILTMRGEIINENTGEIEQIGEPLINQDGQLKITSHLISIVNQTVIMGDIKDKEMVNLLKHTTDSIRMMLMQGIIKYQVKDDISRTIIMTKVRNIIYICLSRPRDGSDKKFWKSSMQEHNITTSINKPKNESGKGLLSKIGL